MFSKCLTTEADVTVCVNFQHRFLLARMVGITGGDDCAVTFTLIFVSIKN